MLPRTAAAAASALRPIAVRAPTPHTQTSSSGGQAQAATSMGELIGALSLNRGFFDDECLVELVVAPITDNGSLPCENHAGDVRLQDHRTQISVVIDAFGVEPRPEGKPH